MMKYFQEEFASKGLGPVESKKVYLLERDAEIMQQPIGVLTGCYQKLLDYHNKCRQKYFDPLMPKFEKRIDELKSKKSKSLRH